MNGVYIPGMEMPDRCFSCPMNDTFSCGISHGSYIEYRDVDVEVAMNGRPDWCPLIPVPHHGRLIDADKLRHSHCAECTLYPDNCLGEECDWDSIFHIDHAKTVIPSDKEDEA